MRVEPTDFEVCRNKCKPEGGPLVSARVDASVLSLQEASPVNILPIVNTYLY